jgi:DNA-binding MurR/RpiR family transcriptional regulator
MPLVEQSTKVVEGLVAAGIRSRLPNLTSSEARVAATILDQGEQLIYRTASEVGSLADAALSTVVRTCQVLGFKGFQDLKIAIAREDRTASPSELHDDVGPADPPRVVLAKLGLAARDAVDLGLHHVDVEQFERAVRAVAATQRLLCLGVGTSAPLAQDAGYRFMWLGLAAEAPADVHVQHVRATLLGPDDVALVISHTGSTRETVAAGQAARDAGATVVAVTSYPRSPLTELADIALVAASRETAYRVEAMASRIAHLVVLDALWVATAVARGEESLALVRRIADVISDHRY